MYRLGTFLSNELENTNVRSHPGCGRRDLYKQLAVQIRDFLAYTRPAMLSTQSLSCSDQQEFSPPFFLCVPFHLVCVDLYEIRLVAAGSTENTGNETSASYYIQEVEEQAIESYTPHLRSGK